MTFDELKTLVFNWCAKPEVEGSLDTLIALTETRIRGVLSVAKITGALKRSETTVTEEYETLPTDFGQPVQMVIQNPDTLAWETMDLISPESLLDLREVVDRIDARPTRWAIVGSSFGLTPAPDREYSIILTYQATVAALSDSNTTNWVSTGYPDVYTYGTLAQVASFLHDDKRLATWNAQFEDAAARMVKAERARAGQTKSPRYRASDLPAGRRLTFNINTGR